MSTTLAVGVAALCVIIATFFALGPHRLQEEGDDPVIAEQAAPPSPPECDERAR